MLTKLLLTILFFLGGFDLGPYPFPGGDNPRLPNDKVAPEKNSPPSVPSSTAKQKKWLAFMIQELGNDNWERRWRAMTFLMSPRNLHQALPLLKKAQSHPDPEVRWRVSQLLRPLSVKQALAWLDSKITSNGQFGYYKGQFSDSIKLPRQPGPALIKIAGDTRQPYKYRYLATLALGEVDITSSRKLLRKISRHSEDKSLSTVAACSLALIGDKSILQEFINQYEQKIKTQPKAGYLYYIRLAQLYKYSGQLKKSIVTYNRAIANCPTKRRGILYYNLACTYSVMKKPQPALTALDQAIKHKYHHYQWMMVDRELENIKDLPQFKKLMAHLQKIKNKGK